MSRAHHFSSKLKPAADWQRRRFAFAVLLVIVAAAALRFWQLGSKSLWIDEASSLYFADRPLAQVLTDTDEFNPPLYYALLHEWIQFFGVSEAALRSLSTLFGVIAVGLAGWLGWLLGGRRLALAAMVLMAAMPASIVYSQMARTYTLFMAASLASFAFLLAWERAHARRHAVGYLCSTVVMCYAHNFWIFNMLVQQLYMLWGIFRRRSASLRQWIGLTVAVLLGFLPWLLVQLGQAAGIAAKGFWSKAPGLEELLDALQHYFVFGMDQRWIWIFLALAAIGLLPLKAVPGTAALKRCLTPASGEAAGSGFLLGLLLFIPLGVPFLWARIGTPIYHQRYAIMSAVALYLLIARGILRLRAPLAQAAVAALLVFPVGSSLARYYASEKEPWREIARVMELLTKTDDTILAVGSRRSSPLTYYYHGAAAVHLFDGHTSPAHEQATARYLTEVTAGRKRIWFVTRRLSLDGPQQPFVAREFFRQHPAAQLIQTKRFSGHLDVYGYAVEAPAQAAAGGRS